jgi:hypothetical protein
LPLLPLASAMHCICPLYWRACEIVMPEGKK